MSTVDPILRWKRILISDLNDRIKDLDILKSLDPEFSKSVRFLPPEERRKARIIRCSVLISMASHFEQFVKSAIKSAIYTINILGSTPNKSMQYTAIRKILRSIKQSSQQTDRSIENLMKLCVNLSIDNPEEPFNESLVTRFDFSKKGITQVFSSIGIDNIFHAMGERAQESTELCLTIDKTWNPHRTAAYLESVTSMLARRNEIVHGSFRVEITIGDAQDYELVTKEFLEGTILVIENLLIALNKE